MPLKESDLEQPGHGEKWIRRGFSYIKRALPILAPGDVFSIFCVAKCLILGQKVL